MKIYYSHPKTYKNSKEATEDIRTLESKGFDVESPYNPKYSDLWQEEGIEFGKVLVNMCDKFAFRPLKNGKISSGAAKELRWAQELGKEILEMPLGVKFNADTLGERVLTMDETVEYFKTIGK